MRPAFWRNRQLAAAALFAVAIFLFARTPVRGAGGSSLRANLFAAGVTAPIVFQPLMNSLIEWPFHILQILWLIITLATGVSLTQMMRFPQSPKWIWITAGLAYSATHALGLGLVVVAAVLSVFVTLLLGLRAGVYAEFVSHRKTIRNALITLAILGTLHAVCMAALNIVSSVPPPTQHFAWTEALGLLALYPFTIVIQIIGAHLDPDLILEIARNGWPSGLLVIVTLGAAVSQLIRRSLRATEASPRISMALSLFSAVALLVFMLMIALRESAEAASQASAYGYLVGARYVFPATILSLGLIVGVSFEFAARGTRTFLTLSAAIVLASLLTNFGHKNNVAPQRLRLHGASDSKIWRYIRATAEEARAANLAIPNIPLKAMTDFPFDLKFFEPLLHDELHVAPNERCQFIDWVEVRGPLRAKYDAAVPSLNSVTGILDL